MSPKVTERGSGIALPTRSVLQPLESHEVKPAGRTGTRSALSMRVTRRDAMNQRQSRSSLVLFLALIAGLCLGAVLSVSAATIPPAAAVSRVP